MVYNSMLNMRSKEVSIAFEAMVNVWSAWIRHPLMRSGDRKSSYLLNKKYEHADRS